MGAVPGFKPSTNGLPYSNNDWPSVPDVKIPTPFGSIGIGNASQGLCGGMTFAVRDLWEAHRAPPTGANPAGGTPGFRYVVDRLIDSFDLPSGVAQYYEWMNLSDHDDLLGLHGTSWRTVNESMPIVRSTIDGGQPCPLGLVCVQSHDPADLGKNHQVLAWAYQDAGDQTTVRVYDPNSPGDDGASLSFDHADPVHTTAFAFSGPDDVRGFFAVPYRPKDPSPLFA